jgi:bifunctional DNA-binding transcriptional regulator/antitoxin component of YhaV-PrlF toxin-antitoxin module
MTAELWDYPEPIPVDDGGRMVLPESLRARIGAEPGSVWHFIPFDGAALVLEGDVELEALWGQALDQMSGEGVTLERLMDDLAEVRVAVNRDVYGDKLVSELKRLKDELDEVPDDTSG